MLCALLALKAQRSALNQQRGVSARQVLLGEQSPAFCAA